MSCAHRKTSYFKFQSKVGYHVVERCDACRLNVNGAGRWVSHFKIKVPVEGLPDDPLHGTTAPVAERFAQTGFKW